MMILKLRHSGGGIDVTKELLKYLRIVLVYILCVGLIGCSTLKSLFNGMSTSINNIIRVSSMSNINKKNFVIEIGDEIVRCIKERDKEGLNNLFCNKIKDTDYLNNQIDFIFNYIDKNGGIIIDNNGKWKSTYSRSSRSDGERTLEYYSCDYSGQLLMNNKQYKLGFTIYKTFKYHKDYEGVINIGIEEYMPFEMIEKFLDYRNDNRIEKRVYLGLNLYNANYDILQYVSVLPKELSENDEYELLDSLEDDREN